MVPILWKWLASLVNAAAPGSPLMPAAVPGVPTAVRSRPLPLQSTPLLRNHASSPCSRGLLEELLDDDWADDEELLDDDQAVEDELLDDDQGGGDQPPPEASTRPRPPITGPPWPRITEITAVAPSAARRTSPNHSASRSFGAIPAALSRMAG